MINWIADFRREQTLGREDWNRPGNPEDILPAFATWRFDWLDVPEIIASAEGIYEFPMVDRDPLRQWSHGRMTLLGDAAHPMYPIGSNGSTQAIRDASAIVDALCETHDVVAALSRYQACRLPATSAIVKSNRELGPEVVMQIAEARAPEGFANIEDVIPRTELEEVAGRYKRLAGFAVDRLNANQSILDEAGN
jgi:2-polyprenyl-6-methoxyphenol hydroxylase-like FAD-dependent oxidoreductase